MAYYLFLTPSSVLQASAYAQWSKQPATDHKTQNLHKVVGEVKTTVLTANNNYNLLTAK